MEKDYLQSLNDRFASYVSRVRQMREQSGRMETANLINTTKILEDEIMALKAMYERQLEELRNKLEEMARERTQHQLAAAKNSASVAELQDKCVNIIINFLRMIFLPISLLFLSLCKNLREGTENL